MNVKILKDEFTLRMDLSKYPKEVTDYVLDQFEDRLYTDLTEVANEIEISTGYEEQKLEVTSIIIELVQRILEEKLRDIEWEKRHNQRN